MRVCSCKPKRGNRLEHNKICLVRTFGGGQSPPFFSAAIEKVVPFLLRRMYHELKDWAHVRTTKQHDVVSTRDDHGLFVEPAFRDVGALTLRKKLGNIARQHEENICLGPCNVSANNNLLHNMLLQRDRAPNICFLNVS